MMYVIRRYKFIYNFMPVGKYCEYWAIYYLKVTFSSSKSIPCLPNFDNKHRCYLLYICYEYNRFSKILEGFFTVRYAQL